MTTSPANQRRRFVSIRIKLLLPLALLLTAVFLLAYFGLDALLHKIINDTFQSDINTALAKSVECIDGDELQSMMAEVNYDNFDPENMDARYESVLTCLQIVEWFNMRAQIFTYSISEEGVVIGGVDVDITHDPENSIWPGEELSMEEDYPEIYNGMINGMQGLYFSPDFVTDEEGTWSGGYSPIQNASGEVVAGLAIFTDANEVISDLIGIRSTIIIVFAVSLGLLLLIVFFISNSATSRIVRLNTGTRRVADGEYTPINIKPPFFSDEVATLTQSFSLMIDKVRGREENLKQRVTELEIIIDESRKQSGIAEITGSEFFQDLTGKAAEMRRRRKKEGGESPK
jgi:HAMP domain-containing protein